METTVLITAFILIGLGVLVKRFPILIAGYNTMSKEEKMNVDVKGLSAFMCYSLVGMGTVPVLAYYICLGLGHADWASYCLFLPILYIPYLIVKANKFDHNPPKKSTKYVVAISVFTIAVIAAFMAYGMNAAITAMVNTLIAVIAAFMAYGMNPATIKIKDDRLVFTGMYGITRTFGEIAGVRLVDSLPDITLRLNGLSIGGISKGWFKLKEGGNCLLLLSSRSKPYIVFTERTGKEIFFNSTNGEITETLYQELKKLIHQ